MSYFCVYVKDKCDHVVIQNFFSVPVRLVIQRLVYCNPRAEQISFFPPGGLRDVRWTGRTGLRGRSKTFQRSCLPHDRQGRQEGAFSLPAGKDPP